MSKVRISIADAFFSVPFVTLDMLIVTKGGSGYQAFRVLEVGPVLQQNGIKTFSAPRLEQVYLDSQKHHGWQPGRLTAKWDIARAFKDEGGYSSVELARLVT